MSKLFAIGFVPATQVILFRSKKYKRISQILRFLSASTTEKLVPVPVENGFWTDKLDIMRFDQSKKIQAHRIINMDGTQISNPPAIQALQRETIEKMYKDMVKLNVMDNILYESQRQGRISFYMTHFGEEGCNIGSAAALMADDLVFSQYREAGVLLWRGYTFDQFVNQCYGNQDDKGKGRQMPIHYGSKELNFVTISSPLGTQLPQAAGAAYAYKRAGKNACVIAYFGEGAASEGDAHAALNFAVTLQCPVIFFCRNNGYAISTPAQEQYGGDGLAGRALGYGLASIRVDGNDTLAVYNATKLAREYVTAENKGILIEAMTYRIGHHSTSDDSSTYRPKEEVEEWNAINNPITRFKNFMEKKGWWNDEEDKTLRSTIRKQVLKAVSDAEIKKKPKWQELFYDVYHEMPHHIQTQMTEMEEHLKIYGNNYPLEDHKNSM